MTDDIPLREAQVIWSYDGPRLDAPPLVVMGHPNEKGRDRYGNRDDRDYSSSWGACLSEFVHASDAERLLMLFQKFQELTVADGLEPRTVHEAFCVIPEYRAALVERGLGALIPEVYQVEA